MFTRAFHFPPRYLAFLFPRLDRVRYSLFNAIFMLVGFHRFYLNINWGLPSLLLISSRVNRVKRVKRYITFFWQTYFLNEGARDFTINTIYTIYTINTINTMYTINTINTIYTTSNTNTTSNITTSSGWHCCC